MSAFTFNLAEPAQLALATIHGKSTKGIPSWVIHPMEHDVIDKLAGVQPGTYRRAPEATYLQMQRNIKTCLLDQYIPTNPLSMGDSSYDDESEHTATTGAEEIMLDGIRIDSPEAVVEHMEKFVFPSLRKAIREFDENKRAIEIIESERQTQKTLGPAILKSGYGFIQFPHLAYIAYGYENYFLAYALYPEIIEKHFSLQAD